MGNSSDDSAASGGEDLVDQFPRAAKMRIDPLEVRFSQTRIRPLFRDRKRLADAVAGMAVKQCTEEEMQEHGALWRLETPFPDIEVIRWRCKLRDEKGEAKVDPDTGKELFDSEERWFSLDNRRLYCLQEVAIRMWPERCVVDVAEVRGGTQIGLPELKKFRTPDLGRSILIGSRSDVVPNIRWSWRDQVQKPRKPPGSSVLVHLLDHDGGKSRGHTEASKKLSKILRRGASASSVAMDSEGWVKVHDLLKLSVFNGIGAEQFFRMVQAANAEKPRYEIKGIGPGQPGVLIRASRSISAQQNLEESDLLGASPAIDEASAAALAAARLKEKFAGQGPADMGAKSRAAASLLPPWLLAAQQGNFLPAHAMAVQAWRARVQAMQAMQALQQVQAAQAMHQMQQLSMIQAQMQAEQELYAMEHPFAEPDWGNEQIAWDDNDMAAFGGIDDSHAVQWGDYAEQWQADDCMEEPFWQSNSSSTFGMSPAQARGAAAAAASMGDAELQEKLLQAHKAALTRAPLQGQDLDTVVRIAEARAAAMSARSGTRGDRQNGHEMAYADNIEARISAALAGARDRSGGRMTA